MKKNRRFISLILALTMIVTAFSGLTVVSVSAEGEPALSDFTLVERHSATFSGWTAANNELETYDAENWTQSGALGVTGSSVQVKKNGTLTYNKSSENGGFYYTYEIRMTATDEKNVVSLAGVDSVVLTSPLTNTSDTYTFTTVISGDTAYTYNSENTLVKTTSVSGTVTGLTFNSTSGEIRINKISYGEIIEVPRLSALTLIERESATFSGWTAANNVLETYDTENWTQSGTLGMSGSNVQVKNGGTLTYNKAATSGAFYYTYAVRMVDSGAKNTVSLAGADSVVLTSPLTNTSDTYTFTTVVSGDTAYTYDSEGSIVKVASVAGTVTGLAFASTGSEIRINKVIYGEVANPPKLSDLTLKEKSNASFSDWTAESNALVSYDSVNWTAEGTLGVTDNNVQVKSGGTLTYNKAATSGSFYYTYEIRMTNTGEKNMVSLAGADNTVLTSPLTSTSNHYTFTTVVDSDNSIAYTYDSEGTVVKVTAVEGTVTGLTFKSTSGEIRIKQISYGEVGTDEPEPAEDPTVTINYEDETLSTTTAMEYSTDDGSNWGVCEADMSATAFGWNGSEAVTVKFRTAAMDENLASEGNTEVTIPARTDITAAEAYTINYANKTITVNSGYNYGTEQNNITSSGDGTTANTFTSGSYYIQKPASDNAFATNVLTVSVPEPAAAPNSEDITINYVDETIAYSGSANVQYSADGESWTDYLEAVDLADLSWNGASKNVYFRTKATSSNYASSAETVTIPMRPAAPSVAGVMPASAGAQGRITGVDTTMEYSSDGNNWTDVTSTELSVVPGNYKVRVKASNSNSTFEGVAKDVTVPEYVAATYTIAGTVTAGSVASAKLGTYDGNVDGTTVTFANIPAGTYELVLTPTDDYKEIASQEIVVTETNENAFNITATAYAKPIISYEAPSNGTLVVKNNGATVTSGTQVKETTELTVEAEPSTGYELATLTAGGNDIKTDKKFTVGTENITVAATFTKRSYKVTKSTATGGSYTITGDGITADTDLNAVPYGTELTITPTADDGYSVGEVSVTGAAVNDNKFTMPAGDVTVSVTFTQDKYTINVGSVSNGTVTPAKTSGIVYNEDVAVTITPAKGYEIDTFTVNGEEKTVTGNTYTLKVTGDTTLGATFKAIDYTISKSVTNGTITVAGTAKYNETVNFTVEANPGYHITAVTYTDEDGATQNATHGSGNSYSLTMPAKNTTITATITEDDKFAINIDSGITHGTVTAAKTANIAANEQVELTITPATGYELGTFKVNNVETAVSGTTYTLTVTADTTVTATFTPITYSITYNNTKDAAIDADKKSYNVETAVTLPKISKDGFTFEGWFDAETDGNKVTEIALGATGNKTYWAHWTEITTPEPDDHGELTDWGTIPAAADTENLAAATVAELEADSAWDIPVSGTGVTKVTEGIQLDADTAVTYKKAAEKPFYFTYKIKKGAGIAIQSLGAISMFSVSSGKVTLEGTDITLVDIDTLSAGEHEFTTVVDTENDKVYTYENGELYGSVKALGNEDTVTGITFTAPESSEMVLESVSYGLMSEESTGAVHNWNFEEINKDTSVFKNDKGDAFNADAFKTKDTSYEYDGLKIVSGGNTSQIDTKGGLKTHKSTGAYIEYTPTKNGTLVVDIYATTADAQICVGTDKNAPTNAMTSHTVTSDEATGKATISLDSVNLVAGTKYYIWNSASKTCHIKNVTFTEFSPEETPNIGIDYETEKLTGFEAGKSYTISYSDNKNTVTKTIEAATAEIAVKADSDYDWFGKTLSIVKKTDAATKNDSEPQTLAVPSIPDAPSVVGVSPASENAKGRITGVDETMEYKKADDENYTAIDAADIKTEGSTKYIEVEVAEDTDYNVRVKKSNTNKTFEGVAATITVPAYVANSYTIVGAITTEDSVTSVKLVGEETYEGVISGTTVTFTGVAAGTYTVNVTAAADYKSATSAPASITVSANDNSAFTITSVPYATPVITLSGGENGTFKVMNGSDEVVSDTAVKEGTELTVTATPNANYKLKTLTYQEDGESAVDISSTKTFTVGTKAITVTAEFEAEASEPEPESHYSYDLATKTHTWDFIGLDTELSNNGQKYNQTYFQADGEYIYEGLTIHGDSSSKFTSEGLQSSNKVQGYIKYTPSKNGTLTITAALDSGAELYVSAGSQDKGGETNANQLTPVSANTFTKDLTANTDYYIFNGSSKKMVVSALKFKESDEEPAPTSYTVSLVTNGGTIASGKNITSYTAGTAVTLPTATDITRDGYTFDGWYENSDFTGSKVETIATNATGNKTYYAKWNSNEPRPEPYIVDDSDENKTVYTWNINAFRDVLEGFNASDFANGAAYTHEELTLNGGTGAALSDDNGMLIKKLSGGGSVANTIAYTPAKNGTLTVTADTAAIKAEIYVSTKVDKSGATRIIYSETKKGIMTGTVDLTAGNTYYIFSGASVDASIKQVVYTADNNSDGPDVPVNPDKPRETFDATDEDKLAVSNASEGGTYEYSTDTRYPVDITSARSGVRTVASNLNVAKNSQHLAFEMTLNTLLKENTTASGAPDTFALEFTSGTGRVGGMLVAKTQTTVDGKDAMQLDWRTGSWQNRLTKPVVVGEKYTYDFVVNTTKDGDTETLDNIDLYIYDKDGKLYDYATGLNRRNATSIQIIYLMAQPRTVGENDSVTIENVRTFYYKPESTLLEIAEGKGKKTLSTETAYNLTADKFNDTEWEFKKPYSMLSDGSTASYMTTAIELKKTDGSALPQNITFDAANRKIKAASGLEAGDYELKATVVSSYNGKEVLREDYPITLTRPVVTPQDVMDDYSPTVEYNGKELAADTAVTDNITLPVSNSVVALKWNSYNSGVISNTGVVTRPLDDTEVTLEVEIASVEDPTKTKKETITVKVQGVRPMLEDAIAKAKAGITSVDDGRTMDADALTDLHEDIKFITKYKNSDYTGYEKVSYAWVSDSDYLKVVENETAEIWPAAVQKYNANLTLTAKYENQKLDEVIPVTINLTKDNAADKYAVRADSIAPANFSNVEGYIGTTISGDITLPTEGIFGSKISWTSSAPTYLSGTGKYKTPSNNTNVTLSAIISKGNVMSDSTKTFKMTLKGKSNESSSGGGGGGGGGGSSSSGKTSTFTTAGTSTAPVYIPPTNQNTDSQNGGAEPSGRFDDLGTVAWAEEAINTLADKGIISGRGDRIFAPNDDITRAEFATIIVNAFDLIDENAECDGLSDVTEDAWYYRYIASAYNNGIISGYDDGRFGVNDKITRQDMAVIIYRAMNSLGVEIEEVEDEIIFSDSDSISDYAKAAVTALQKADIVNGVGDDEFAPLATATRAQAAVIIFNTQR